jgi:hypothetical protein
VCTLYVPTAAVWGAAYVVGPGFSVGGGTAVAIGGTTLGAVPAFPLLAALPQHGTGWTGAAAALVPLAAGLTAGWATGRAGSSRVDSQVGGWRQAVLVGLGSGAVAGIALAALCLSASGSGGPGRMGQVGPSAWASGLAAAAEVGIVASATLVVRQRRLA